MILAETNSVSYAGCSYVEGDNKMYDFFDLPKNAVASDVEKRINKCRAVFNKHKKIPSLLISNFTIIK